MRQVMIFEDCFGLIPLTRIVFFVVCSILVLSLEGQEGYQFVLGDISLEHGVPKEDELSECEEINFFRGEKVYDAFLDSQNFLWVLSESGVYRRSGEDFIDMSMPGLELSTRSPLLSHQKINLPAILEGDYGNLFFLGDFRTSDMKHCILVYNRDDDRMRTVELSSALVAVVENSEGLILLLEKDREDVKLVRCLFNSGSQVRQIANVLLSENTSYSNKLNKVEIQGDSVLVFGFHGHNFLGFFFDKNEIKIGFSNRHSETLLESKSDYFFVDEDLFNDHRLNGEEVYRVVDWRVENNNLYACKIKSHSIFMGAEKVHDVKEMHGINYLDSVMIDSICLVILGGEGPRQNEEVNHIVDESGTNWLQIDNNVFSWNWEDGRRSVVYVDTFSFEKEYRIPIASGVLHRLYPNHEVFYTKISNFELIAEGLVSINIGDENFISLGLDRLRLIRVKSKYPIIIDSSGASFLELDSGLILVSPFGAVDSIHWDRKYGNVSKILTGYDNNTWVITWSGVLIFDHSWKLVHAQNRKFLCFSASLSKSVYGERRFDWADVIFDGTEEWLVFLTNGSLSAVNGSGLCKVLDLTKYDVGTVYKAKVIAENEVLVFTDVGVFEMCFGKSIEYSLRYKIFNKRIGRIANPVNGVYIFSASDSTFYQQVHWFDINKGGGKIGSSRFQDFAGLGKMIVYTAGHSVWWKSSDNLSAAGKLIHKFTGRHETSIKRDSEGNVYVLGSEAVFFVDKYWHPGVGRDIVYHVPFPLVDEEFRLKANDYRKKYVYLNRFQNGLGNFEAWNNNEDDIFDVLGGVDEDEYKNILDLFRKRFSRVSKEIPVPYLDKVTVAAPQNKVRQLRATFARFHSAAVLLNANENDLEFRIGSNYHINPAKVTYSYKLENWNNSWSDLTSNPVVNYQNLTPGTYTFKFFAMNEYGRSAPEPTTYTFTIRWPWYKTWTAWGSFLLGFLGVVYASARYYINDKLRIQMAVEQEREQTRERLGSDFHDNAGQDITKMQLMLGIARNSLVADVTRISSDLGKMQETMNSLNNKIRDFTWSLKTDDNSLDDLCQRLKTAGYELFNLADIRFEAFVEIHRMEGLVLSPSIRQDVLLLFREVMNNCVKYSEATAVRLHVNTKLATEEITISFEDNGIGFDPNDVHAGNGMRILRQRADSVGGKLLIDTAVSKGVRVSLTFTCRENKNK